MNRFLKLFSLDEGNFTNRKQRKEKSMSRILKFLSLKLVAFAFSNKRSNILNEEVIMLLPIIIALFFLITTPDILNAQPDVDWVRTYHANGHDRFTDIYAVPANGYALCGRSYEIGENWRFSSSMWIVRIDENGNLDWSQTYGQAESRHELHSLIETDQGNFLAGGRQGDDFAAILVNSEGEEIWRRTYGNGTCYAVIELKSGEFLLAGKSTPAGVVVLIDNDGDVIWDETYSTEGYNRFRAMRETEGGIVLAGYTIFQNQRLPFRIWVVKIDFDGEMLWSRHITIFEAQTCISMDSLPGGGFVLGGICDNHIDEDSADFILLVIDDRGNPQWFRRYDIRGRLLDDGGGIITRLSQNGYVMVGYEHPQNEPWLPSVISIMPNGVERWHRFYSFEEHAQIAPEGHVFCNVIEAEDNSVIAVGFAEMRDEDLGRNGFIIKLEQEILQPQFITWVPHDTIMPTLIDDTLTFRVEVNAPDLDALRYLWLMEDDTLSMVDSAEAVFDEFGEHELRCFVTNGEFTVSIGWHVSVVEWYIYAFMPDTLEMTIRRSTNIDFSLDIAAIENIELNYLWTLTDRNRHREEVGDTDSVTIYFDLAGDFQLEGFVWRGEESDEVNWDIYVRSVVWYWWPREDSLMVPVDTTLLFAITPFNPDSDSLEYLWTLDGDTIDFEQEIEILFEEMGLCEVVAYVHDGCEADTIRWDVTVIPPVNAPEPDAGLLPMEPVLYPPAPNPFNAKTTARFYTPDERFIDVFIYDLTGRVVSKVHNGLVLPGEHSIYVDARDLPAGVYLLVMRSDGAVTGKRKIAIIR